MVFLVFHNHNNPAMEKIKKMLPLLITVFLFFVPFFWFNPGEVNLGGDNSRLYFYKPMEYLQSYLLYNVAPSDLGYENISFFMIPFTFLMYLLLGVFGSPSVLLNFYHGFVLSAAFLFTYLTVIRLFQFTRFQNTYFLVLAAVISGLFYVTNPILGTNWDKALLSHNQFFLNPLIFYLILGFIQTGRWLPLLVITGISFIFASNFGYISAPSLFSFYPFLLFYIALYTVVLKRNIYWRKLILFIILLIGVHSFHILPQLGGIFSHGSPSSNTVFSMDSKFFARNHFLSIADGISLSNNLLSRNQSTTGSREPWAIVFMTVVLAAVGILIFKRKQFETILHKNYLILLITFFILLFFTTANITRFGLDIYAQFFSLPGFQMFRNYYGQFAHSYFLFFSLIFGSGLVIVFSVLSKRLITLTSIFLGILFIFIGVPLFSGHYVNKPMYQSKNIRVPHKINTDFEQSLTYISSLENGKILTLPLTSYGYQLVGGEEGGVYKGPSMIGYLTGKKDFTGYQHFGPYTDLFITSLENNDHETILEIFSLLNIRYIFHNNDPYIYENFLFPYDDLKDYFPDQKSITQFVKNLGVNPIHSVGSFTLYELPESYKRQYISAPKKLHSALSPDELALTLLGEKLVSESALVEDSLHSLVNVKPVSIYETIIKDFPVPVAFPYVKWSPQSIVYPLITLKEQLQVAKSKDTPIVAIDTHLLFAAKRISELEKWGDQLPVASVGDNQNWETNLYKYSDHIRQAIEISGTLPENEKVIQQVKIREDINGHVVKLERIISQHNLSPEDADTMQLHIGKLSLSFERSMSIPKVNPLVQAIPFDEIPGAYELYVKLDDLDDRDDLPEINIGSDNFSPDGVKKMSDFFYYGDVELGEEIDLMTFTFPRRSQPKIVRQRFIDVVDVSDVTKTEINEFIFQEKNLTEGQAVYISEISEGHHLMNLLFDPAQTAYQIGFFVREKNEKENQSDQEFEPIFYEFTKINPASYTAVVNTENIHDMYLLVKPLDQNTLSIDASVEITMLPPQPHVYLKRVQQPLTLSAPLVSTVSQNPIRHLVNVSDAYDSYFLIQSDAFDTSWKVYKRDVSIQGSHVSAFETIFSKPLEIEHLRANGYANAWKINPEDVGPETDYQLIIEKSNQRLFYLGVLITSGSFIIAMVLLFRQLMKKKHVKNSNRFGGERLDSKSSLAKNNKLEHLARYKMVKPNKSGVVLDVGSAEGHGSEILASKFKKVIGIDISKDAVSRAKKFNRNTNVVFKIGSATDIPLKTNSIDSVAAFEVVEHIEDWKKFLSELHRVVRPGGRIYMSTPNKAVYNPWSKNPINPHHVFEWYIPEFKNALKKYFDIVEFYGQRTPVYNDHKIWKVMDPLLYALRNVISYKTNNSIKLKIINRIKPQLEESDIVFVKNNAMIKKSRTMFAVCKNKR